MSRFWNKLVATLDPYVPGEQPRIQNLVKLNTNEHPYGPSPKVLAAIAAHTNDSLRLYPDPTALVGRKWKWRYLCQYDGRRRGAAWAWLR